MQAAVAVMVSAVLAAGPPTVISGATKRPEHVGQCFNTRVLSVGTRLGDGQGRNDPGSGSAITLADGHGNVSYEQLPGIDRSRPGDRVRLCVIRLPEDCPKGDTRGITYRGRNLRTGLTWTASDFEHGCGGG
jgi:hypothetical protein